MSEVFENVDPEVGAVMLDPLLARPNVETAVYSRERRALTVTGSGSLQDTLRSVLQYRLDQLAAIQRGFDAAVRDRRSGVGGDRAAAPSE